MKKILFGIILLLFTFGFYNWQKPPVEYIVITKHLGDSSYYYWDNDDKKKISLSSLDEAMNKLSFKNFKFQSMSISAANGTECLRVIMSK